MPNLLSTRRVRNGIPRFVRNKHAPRVQRNIERLWRSPKYEEVYSKDYRAVVEARDGIGRYFHFHNHQGLHQSMGYCTPAATYAQQA